MKALVLGATGFVGANVVRALVAGGHDAVAARRPRGNTLWLRKLGAPMLPVLLDDPQSLVAAMKGRDVVFHCAGHYPRYSLDLATEVAVARRTTRAIVDAAARAGVGRLVLTSSVATIGAPAAGRRLSDERDALRTAEGRGVYHSVKIAIEQEALAPRSRGPAVILMCPTGIFGELDVKVGTAYPIFALAHGKLAYYVEGKTNVVDADEVAKAHLAAACLGRHGERFVLAGHNLAVGELLTEIADLLGVPFVAKRLPTSVAALAATMAEMTSHARADGSRPFLAREMVDIVRHGLWVDGERARMALGLPSPAPLRTTLAKAIDFYRRYRFIPPAAGTQTDRRAWAVTPTTSE